MGSLSAWKPQSLDLIASLLYETRLAGCMGSSGTTPGWQRMARLVAGVSRATRHAGAVCWDMLGRSWSPAQPIRSPKKNCPKGNHRETIV